MVDHGFDSLDVAEQLLQVEFFGVGVDDPLNADSGRNPPHDERRHPDPRMRWKRRRTSYSTKCCGVNIPLSVGDRGNFDMTMIASSNGPQ